MKESIWKSVNRPCMVLGSWRAKRFPCSPQWPGSQWPSPSLRTPWGGVPEHIPVNPQPLRTLSSQELPQRVCVGSGDTLGLEQLPFLLSWREVGLSRVGQFLESTSSPACTQPRLAMSSWPEAIKQCGPCESKEDPWVLGRVRPEESSEKRVHPSIHLFTNLFIHSQKHI